MDKNKIKKKLVIILILAVLIVGGYRAFDYKMKKDEFSSNQIKAIPVTEVPEAEKVACDTYPSEKEVREAAIKADNEKVCNCVRDDAFRSACRGVITDLRLYKQALSGHEENTCSKMTSEPRKSACLAALKNSSSVPSKGAVIQWSSCENGKQLAVNWEAGSGGDDSGSFVRDCNGKCGTANMKEYEATDVGFGGATPCEVGTPNPPNPFPEPGKSVTWICGGMDGGVGSGNCVASRKFYTCTGDFPNAKACPIDSNNLIVPTSSILVDSCNTSHRCEFVCDISQGYHRQNQVCVKNSAAAPTR